MSRTILFVVVLMVAAGAPYLISKSKGLVEDSGDGETPIWSRLTGAAAKEDADSPQDPTPTPDEDLMAGRVVDTQMSGPIGYSVADLLRFDITPNWVMQTWNLVTTDLPNSSLSGIRVPVVTGTDPTDVAGSLTYYFNKNQRLERISLHGFCTDPSSVLTLAQQRFALRQYASQGTPTYLAYFGDHPISMMRVQPMPKKDGNATRQYEIDLELNLPREGAMLSAEKLMILFRMRQADMI